MDCMFASVVCLKLNASVYACMLGIPVCLSSVIERVNAGMCVLASAICLRNYACKMMDGASFYAWCLSFRFSAFDECICSWGCFLVMY